MAGADRSAAGLAIGAICAFVVVVGALERPPLPAGRGLRRGRPHRLRRRPRLRAATSRRGRASTTRRPASTPSRAPLDWVAERLGVGEPHRGGDGAQRALRCSAPSLLVWLLARELWPGRERLALGAAAFVAFAAGDREGRRRCSTRRRCRSSSARSRSGSACARSPTARYALALGRRARRRAARARVGALDRRRGRDRAASLGRRWRELAVVLVLAAADPGAVVHPPARQVRRLAGLQPAGAGRSRSTSGGRSRFYVDPGLPEVVTKPYRPHFLNLALPTTYTELWGDYFGVWAWNGRRHAVGGGDARELQRQSVVGLVPTLLAVVGWLAFLLALAPQPAAARGRAAAAARDRRLPLLHGLATRRPTATCSRATYMLTTTAGLGARLRLRARPPPRPVAGWVVLALLGARARSSSCRSSFYG